MLNESLHRVLCKDCKMSDRPSYYSGRGATTTDLGGAQLEMIYKEIKRQAEEPPCFGQKPVPAGAHEQFVAMVKSLPSLGATDFLVALSDLEAANWVWNEPRREGIPGVDLNEDDEDRRNLVAAATVFGMLSRDDKADARNTRSIRCDFLRRIGGDDDSPFAARAYGYTDYGCEWDG